MHTLSGVWDSFQQLSPVCQTWIGEGRLLDITVLLPLAQRCNWHNVAIAPAIPVVRSIHEITPLQDSVLWRPLLHHDATRGLSYWFMEGVKEGATFILHSHSPFSSYLHSPSMSRNVVECGRSFYFPRMGEHITASKVVIPNILYIPSHTVLEEVYDLSSIIHTCSNQHKSLVSGSAQKSFLPKALET